MYDDVVVRHFIGQIPDRIMDVAIGKFLSENEGMSEQEAGRIVMQESISMGNAIQLVQQMCFGALRALDEEVLDRRNAQEMNEALKDLVVGDEMPDEMFSARPYPATQDTTE
jgi:hypothetical protein